MQTKLCPKCGENHPLSAFNKDKSKPSGLCSYCRVCASKNHKSWVIKNPEKPKENMQKWLSCNGEKKKSSDKIWRDNNKEKIRKYLAEYYETNTIEFLARVNKRRAARIQRTPRWLTEEHYQSIKEMYEIAQMFRLYTGQEYHVDHIIPLQGKTVSGLHVPWNLQILTASDNIAKGAKFTG